LRRGLGPDAPRARGTTIRGKYRIDDVIGSGRIARVRAAMASGAQGKKRT